MSLHSSARIELNFLVFGFGRSVSSSPLLDLVEPGLTSVLQSHCHLGLFTSAIDFLHIGSSPLIHNPARYGSAFLTFGITHLEVMPSTPDHTSSGSVLIPKSPVCTGSPVMTMDFSHMGFTMATRATGRSGLASLVFGIAWSSSSVLVSNSIKMGPFLFFQSLTHVGLASPTFRMTCSSSSLFLLEYVQLGLLSSSRSSACPGVVLLTTNSVHMDLLILLRSFAYCRSSFSVSGIAQPNLCSFVPDLLSLDSSMLSHSFAHVDTSMLTIDSLHSGSVLPLRFTGCIGLAFLSSGIA